VRAGRPLSGILALKLANTDREKVEWANCIYNLMLMMKTELMTPHSVETNTYLSKRILASAATALAPCQNTTLGTTRERTGISRAQDPRSGYQDIEQV